ncbi:MAG TPA: AAA family ATPase [Solirubrobacteraceae bacterium]|nr:AAA family ATPase [Solirubrobacteraceae bacterium]
MYLKSIVLKGFKSFPDRTRLEFGPGVSVIVGPNGSGKSNVTDAVLWALGEQSPLAVRGQSMQDVIFAGAPGRQASRSAEVELILDDSDGVLGLGMPEVSILRRLDRTGEGEYRLAGARCRLVDVIEVLSDTGLGKEMHSVISQGRVESIVTSKPRDRRLLIEEAAGLGKHRKRRRRAQLKLARTQDNLDRALDVEREARSRLRPLKRQAEAAELHERLERQSLEARWELARDDLRSQRALLAGAQAEAAATRAQRERLEQELEGVARRREAAEEALAGRSAQREELSRRCFVAQSVAERVADRLGALRASAASAEDRLRQTRAQLAALDSEGEGEAADPEAEGRIARLEGELAELERDREERLAGQLAALEAELIAAREIVAERSAELETVTALRAQAEERSEHAATQLRQAERGVEAARRQAARVGAELAVVNQFLRTQAGRPGDAAILADQLKVDPGYEHAVAAALDGRLRAAVVRDRTAAETLLDSAGADGARTLLAGASASPAAGREAAPTAGAERLSDHVRGPSEVVELVRTLLAGTWVVDSLDGLPASFAGVAVTRGGRVWSAPSREIRQAPAVGEERVLAERNRREQLIADSETAAQAEQAAASALERATAEFQEAETGREAAIVRQRNALRERDEAAEQERRTAATIERRRAAPEEGPGEDRRRLVVAEIAAERDKLSRAAAERAERARRTERLRRAVARDEALSPSLERTIETLGRVAEAITLQRNTFDAALAADREAGEHVAAELRTCAREEAALQAQLHTSTEAVTRTEVAFLRARDRAAEVEGELKQLAGRLELEAAAATDELAAEQRAALEGRLERLTRRREQLGPVNPLAQQEYAEAVEHVEELERQRSDLEAALRELEKLISDTDRQIRETFEQTLEAAARNFEQVAAQLFPGGHGRLRLVADAEGQPRVLGGDGAGGDSEPADGDEAGEAEATPEEDRLGVEIEINPAGKEMKRLTLLSGGEKSMTALAFLFAVFLASPCPFYILDEVEAALDDLNIDRFLGLLRAYSQQAQFIVVTHQRRTMEAADILYGVSMGSDGVSKVISQRLPREAEAAA